MPIQKSPYFVPSIIAVVLVIGIGATALVMSQSKKESESKNTNSSSSSISKSEDKMESKSSSSEMSVAANSLSSAVVSNLKTYTDAVFPEFKLVYPNDWKFENTSKPAPFVDSLASKSLKLTKNNVNIDIFLNPKGSDECGGAGAKEIKTEKLKNGVNKVYYNLLQEDGEFGNIPYVTYGDLNSCIGGNLISNLDITKYPDYKKDVYGQNVNDKNIFYTYSIALSKGMDEEFRLEESNPIAKEIDQILSQSTFK